jgi:GDPmannose 4,6-dehydratase
MGNIDSFRDWGHAKDYVEGMWLILQHDVADDFVLATGKMHSVREFIEKAFAIKNIEIEWKGEGVNEVGYDKNTQKEYIFIDPKYFRPAEVELLIGDATKAKTLLNWRPKINFEDLVKTMVQYDCSD